MAGEESGHAELLVLARLEPRNGGNEAAKTFGTFKTRRVGDLGDPVAQAGVRQLDSRLRPRRQTLPQQPNAAHLVERRAHVLPQREASSGKARRSVGHELARHLLGLVQPATSPVRRGGRGGGSSHL